MTQLDIIGNIYTASAFDAEGIEVLPTVKLEGWHVNSPEAIEGWECFSVIPSNPRRVFAGHETFYYRFTDEDAFRAAALEKGLIQIDTGTISETNTRPTATA